MSNSLVHFELNTPDMVGAKKFYTEMFGWAFEDIHMGGGMIYSMFKMADGLGGGMASAPGAPTSWLGYIGVDDIQVATAKAVSLGAKLMMGPHEVPGRGWLSILVDPTGAAIAMWQDTTSSSS